MKFIKTGMMLALVSAVFWLANSDDEEAVAALAELLTR